MPEKCDLWRNARTQDSQGGYEVGDAEPYAGEVACRLTTRSGRQVEAGGAIRTVEEYWLTIPYDQQILPDDRVSHNGLWYVVRSVSDNSYDSAKRVVLGRTS